MGQVKSFYDGQTEMNEEDLMSPLHLSGNRYLLIPRSHCSVLYKLCTSIKYLTCWVHFWLNMFRVFMVSIWFNKSIFVFMLDAFARKWTCKTLGDGMACL